MTQPERNPKTGQGAGNPPRPVYDPLPERRNFLRALAAMFTDKADGEFLVVDAASPGGVSTTAGGSHIATPIAVDGTEVIADVAGDGIDVTAPLTVTDVGGVATITLAPASAGDMLYFDGSNWVAIDQAGASDGDVLTRVSGLPAWQPLPP